MAASKTIGGINVTISASTQKFQAGLTRARKLLVGFTASIKRAIFSVKGFAVALAGAAGFAGFAVMVKNGFEAVDALGKLSTKLGVATDKLYGIQLAADEAGISQAVLEKALVKLSTTYGIEGSQALRLWIRDTLKLGTHHERLAAAVEMFGARGASMVGLLKGGIGALDEAQQAAEGLGMALSKSVVAGVERANDAFKRLKSAIQGIFANVAAELAPFVEALSVKATGFLTQPGKIAGVGKSIADAIISTAKLVADGIQKMVGGVLEMIAEVRSFFYDLRSSRFASAAGFGYSSPNAGLAAAGAMAGARRRADEWNTARRWSSIIEYGIQSAVSAASTGQLTGPDFSKPASRRRESVRAVVRPGQMADDARFAALLQPIADVLAERRGEKSMTAFLDSKASRQSVLTALLGGKGSANLDAFAPKPSGRGMVPPLTLAESGSVESYRQQAAIRRQGANIQAKQLKTQTGMLAELRKLNKAQAPMAAANL